MVFPLFLLILLYIHCFCLYHAIFSVGYLFTYVDTHHQLMMGKFALTRVCYMCRYGMGMIYYKQEKFNLAETHYRKALSINPQSSVLLCHIGVVSLQTLHVIYFYSAEILIPVVSFHCMVSPFSCQIFFIELLAR